MSNITLKTLEIPPFIVMDVMERAHELEIEGRDAIHLEVGEPDFDPPACICEAAKKALDDGLTHYTHSLGLPELRQAICEHYHAKYGVSIDPDRVLITSGTSPALFMVFAALLNPGDEIILSDPHYPCYPNVVRFLGARPRFVHTEESDGFQLMPDEISQQIGPRTRAVMINSPSNPTGNLLSAGRMAQIAQLGLPVISDEIYHGLVYGDKEHSILEFTDNAFVLNGFSKLYAMTGWRLGYLIAPPQFIRPLQKVQQNFFISASSIAQAAGIAALRHAGADVEKMRATYDERRRYMIARVREIGFGLPVEPRGAFYMLVNARHLAANSYDLAFEILEKVSVGVSPGIDFGASAEGYLRLCYANSLEKIRDGLERLEAFVKGR